MNATGHTTRAPLNFATHASLLSAHIDTTWLSIPSGLTVVHWTPAIQRLSLTQRDHTKGHGQRVVPQPSMHPLFLLKTGGNAMPGLSRHCFGFPTCQTLERKRGFDLLCFQQNHRNRRAWSMWRLARCRSSSLLVSPDVYAYNFLSSSGCAERPLRYRARNSMFTVNNRKMKQASPRQNLP